MDNWIPSNQVPKNEPIWDYLPGSVQAEEQSERVRLLTSSEVEISPIVNGKEIRTGATEDIRPPHNHHLKVGHFHQVRQEEVRAAIAGALEARKGWAQMPAEDRAAIFLKAADLISSKYRALLNAATMVGQSKTVYQAEIDSACELIDFLRFNVHFQQNLFSIQPKSPDGVINRLEYRPLEGFVFAVTPFNFTAIGGNLPCSAALMGNVVLWKPASTQVYSAHFFMKILEEAGLPPGVIQFLPGRGREVGDMVINDPNLAGIHFTGSTGVFQGMWKSVGDNIANYRTYPRIVGETGGKDFILAHPSADCAALTAAIIRGAFEYQGQKCSAASRAYIPKSVWDTIKDQLVLQVSEINMGDVADFSNFMSAVIDRKSFEKITGYIEQAKKDSDANIIVGGGYDDKIGYFIEPTIIEVTDPKYRTMEEELFGPVLSVYVYEDNKFDDVLKLVNETSPYALTGCVWSQDRAAIRKCHDELAGAAGNFYINNKPTGAVVGQQPFGGSRASGTNDKAGSMFNLIRWVSMRTVSETLHPPTDYSYPFMG